MVSMAGCRWDVTCRPAQLLRGAGAPPHVDNVLQASGSSKTGIRRTEIGGFYLFFCAAQKPRRSGGQVVGGADANTRKGHTEDTKKNEKA